MQSTIKIQYLTNEHGEKTAVQIPYKEWIKLLQDYTRLKHLAPLKKEITDGLLDLIAIEQEKSKEITLSEFLNES